MKSIYLAILVTMCFAIITGCLNLGTDQQGFVPATKDRTAEGYSQSVYPTMAPTPGLGGSALSGMTDQKLIKTGYLNLEVKGVPDTVERVKEIALHRGGYVASSSISGETADRLRATVVVRVPAAAFDNTIADIKGVGTLLSASVSADDVTMEYVDLQAQKGAFQRQLEQYNRIMEKAEKVEDVLKIQVEIERVQVELDRLEGRLRYLDNRIDYGTLTVSLQEPAPLGGDTGHNFVSVINSGIQGFLGMIDAIIIAVFTFLPLILLGGVAYGIYRWKKGRKASPSPPPVVQETGKQ